MKSFLAAVLLVVAACSSSIAGFELGGRRYERGLPDLGEQDTNACYGYRTVAEAKLNEDAPAHAPIVASEVYVDPVRVTLGGFGVTAIGVLLLADETVHAYRVQCGVGLARDICLAVDRASKASPAASKAGSSVAGPDRLAASGGSGVRDRSRQLRSRLAVDDSLAAVSEEWRITGGQCWVNPIHPDPQGTPLTEPSVRHMAAGRRHAPAVSACVEHDRVPLRHQPGRSVRR